MGLTTIRLYKTPQSCYKLGLGRQSRCDWQYTLSTSDRFRCELRFDARCDRTSTMTNRTANSHISTNQECKRENITIDYNPLPFTQNHSQHSAGYDLNIDSGYPLIDDGWLGANVAAEWHRGSAARSEYSRQDEGEQPSKLDVTSW